MKTVSIQTRLAILAAFLLIAFNATADRDRGDRDGRHGPPSAEMMVARMTEKLDLSDEQSAQLLAVMQDVDLERKAAHQKVMDLMKPELCELQLRTEADIASILTPEQLAELEEIKDARAGKRSGRGFRGMDQLDCTEYE